MFSFAKVASFAVLALGTLASASALPAVKNAAPVAASKATIQKRDDTSIAAIFANLNTALTPVLSGLTGATDAATVQAGISEVTSLIQSATTSLSGLTGEPQSEALATLDGTGTLSVSDVAGLLGGLLNTVLGVLGPLTTGTDATGGLDLLTPLLDVVSSLLSAVLSLLGTSGLPLLGDLLPLILGLLPTLLELLLPILLGLLSL